MKYSEQTLQNWTVPLSQTEERRADNTIKMVRKAIDENEDLRSMNIEVFIQGSYANNTNVRTESDVDVCVMLKDVFYAEYPDGKKSEDYGFISSDMTFNQYRNLIKRALQNKFGVDYVCDGNKSLKVNENTYHVQADVVPAFQLRNYYYWGSMAPNQYIEGTCFLAQDGKKVSNYAKRHLQNGKDKNKATNYNYKKLVRIMKHIKNNMVEDKKVDGDKITSFLVECLVYQIPNDIITNNSTWTETVRQAIIFLYNEIKEGRHTEWCEVSDMLYLFRGRKWTDLDAKQWLYDVWNYLEYGV